MNYELRNKSVIVTGCYGQIGSKLCEELDKMSIQIFGIDFLEEKSYELGESPNNSYTVIIK